MSVSVVHKSLSRRYSVVMFTLYILHCHSRPHHVVVEGRVVPFFKQYRFDEDVYLVNVKPEVGGYGQPVAIDIGNDDSYINIAFGLGIALGVGAVHKDFRLDGKPWGDYSLVVSDELEGFVSGKNSCIIHCCICFVLSMISRHFCSLSERAMPVL